MPDTLIDIICDLRNQTKNVDDIGGIESIWQIYSKQMIGLKLETGVPLQVSSPTSSEALVIWVLDPHGQTQITNDSSFNVVDVLRNPKLLYTCRVCGEYGPLRCVKCEEKEGSSRLCSKHAYFIEDELAAYCEEHIPSCSCSASCTERADFRCSRCHRLYGKHFRKAGPQTADGADKVYYCNRCYSSLFEQCDVCSKARINRLGKSTCAYHSISTGESCGLHLCWEHSYQWKIWGPHNRGVTLCEYHKRILSSADPQEILFTVLAAKAPYAGRGKRQSLPNPFRLRRMINRHRTYPLTFDQLYSALANLQASSVSMNSHTKRNFDYMTRSFQENIAGIGNKEQEILYQIREFYRMKVGADVAAAIAGAEIVDRFYKPGEPSRFRVQVKVNLPERERGRLIGTKGSVINLLKSQLNVEVDLV
ncbi:MAG: KH domain-containing protein [Anaerolineae bacterium]